LFQYYLMAILKASFQPIIWTYFHRCSEYPHIADWMFHILYNVKHLTFRRESESFIHLSCLDKLSSKHIVLWSRLKLSRSISLQEQQIFLILFPPERAYCPGFLCHVRFLKEVRELQFVWDVAPSSTRRFVHKLWIKE
jgi:hypothetical protein